jgi:hypothetical protein
MSQHRTIPSSVIAISAGVSRRRRGSPIARLQVPAGALDTYRIEKATGTETYHLLVTRDLPRMLLREDFPDGIAAELVAISESRPSPPGA